MEVLKELTEQGKELGYTGEELQKFVTAQQERLREERMLAREREREERDFALRKLELESKFKAADTSDQGHAQVHSSIKTPKIPAFDEARDDMDAYLRRFERYATANKWGKELWAVSLSALLKGKALEVFSRLSVDDSLDYEKLKAALLKRFDLTEEGFKIRFRTSLPDKGETFQQFAVRQAELLRRWIGLSGVEQSFDGLFDLIMREQFVNIVKRDLALFLKERSPSTIGAMSDLADKYREARVVPVVSLVRVPGSSFTGSSTSNTSGDRPKQQSTAERGVKPTSPPTGNQVDTSKRRCYRCGKWGHIASEGKCPKSLANGKANAVSGAVTSQGSKDGKGGKSSKQQSSEKQDDSSKVGSCAAFLSLSDSLISTSAELSSDVKLSESCGVQASVPNMPTASGLLGSKVVTVLRDTGCSGVVVRSSCVDDLCLTDRVQTCVLADGSHVEAPIARVFIDTPFYKGEHDAWCMANPIYDLIIGNIDGARDPGSPDLSWKLEVGAVQTRQQAAREKATCKPHRLKVLEAVGVDIGPEDMRRDQESDSTLDKLRQRVDVNSGTSKVSFTFKHGLLYRVYTPDDNNPESRCMQLVVPEKHRSSVLKLAHESIMSAHLGIKRTESKVLAEFYWPGVHSDVKRFCRSCDVCQRTVPKGKITKAPLGKMPLIEVPFQRVAVDLVGPIEPRSASGCRYILTLVDYATRYPEAVALPSIDTERVAEALLDMFCRIGVPREMLSDLGTQFTSELMQEVSRLLSIRRLTTTPYHPMCNGLVESFNGQLKQMLKRLCAERPKDWDKYLNPVLFAYRDAPQESLGFSPFELVYGRSVRGPLAILKELWTKEIPDEEVKTTYQYVVDLRERLERTCEVAYDNLKKSAGRYKKYFDQKAKPKDLQVGSKVLVLLPTKRNKLLLQWRGPYEIVQKVGSLDYRICIKGKLKTFHANMLKAYYDRDDPALLVTDLIGSVSVAVVDVECEENFQPELGDIDVFAIPSCKQGGDESAEIPPCHVAEDLSVEQKVAVETLISEFSDVLSDKPGHTNLLTHDIKLTTSEPIRSKQYPVPFAMRQTIVDEVNKMLELDVIEPSDSPYCSNIVIVKKSDGTNRFCIDFRAINRYTVFDSEPIPDMEEIFARISRCKFISKIDLTKGYWQLPLLPEVRKYTAFQTPVGLFQFKVLPFGMVCASASFSRLMRKLLGGMESVENFIDDIIVYTATFLEHINVLREVFGRLRKANLTAKPSKCFLCFRSVECLGHVVGHNELRLNPDKVKVISEAQRPCTKKQVRSFLGLIGFYRKFVPNFAAIACPLTDLTKKGQPQKVAWGESQEKAFLALKKALCSSPILKLPEVDKEFVLQTDASDIGIGAVLLQEEDGAKKPVAYASRKLKKAELSYATIEKECLAIVWAILKFSRFLYGQQFVLETDHQPLLYLNRSKVANARLMRWALMLQPYRFRIVAIAGKDNVGADYLSRL